MNIFVIISLAILIIIIMLQRKIPIGFAMLTAGLFIWAFHAPDPAHLITGVQKTMTMSRTYDVLIALYGIMCFEVELRASGALSGMVNGLEQIFSSIKLTLASMPAFLGFLPSLGGAIFSAPIVEEASKGLNLSPEHKTAINFWFRHIFEFSNPIIPGMIIACSIVGVPFSQFVSHLAWLTVVAFLVGYFYLMVPIKNAHVKPVTGNKMKYVADILLCLFPVLSNFILVMVFHVQASVAMISSTIVMYLLLKFLHRNISIKEILIGAIDKKMFGNVLMILIFIQLLIATNVLTAIVAAFKASPLPIPVIIAAISFIIGILTGMSQGHVAIIMPIVAALAPGDMRMTAIAMAFGVGGQMLTPTHVCFTVTIDYFNANFIKSLIPIMKCEITLLAIFTLVTYLTW